MALADCRWIESPPADGAWNMAADEALLDQAAAQGGWVLRLYAWQPATLSLGYFQRWTDRRQHTASSSCPLVRRPSGGGAILHDRECTYSLIAPAGTRWARQPATLYDAAHHTLVAALAELGIAARRHRAAPAAPPSQEPFLCFARRVDGDVLVGDWKIAGSAQRRRHGAVLQHGSILLETSPFAPELAGLNQAAGQTVSPEQLLEAWLPRLAQRLEVVLRPDELDPHTRAAAAQWVEAKYASDDWNFRR